MSYATIHDGQALRITVTATGASTFPHLIADQTYAATAFVVGKAWQGVWVEEAGRRVLLGRGPSTGTEPDFELEEFAANGGKEPQGE